MIGFQLRSWRTPTTCARKARRSTAGFSKTPAFCPTGTSPCRAIPPIPTRRLLLAAFLLTKEGQDILWKTEKTSSHLVEGTNMYKFVKDQERQGVKFYANPVSDVVKNHENQSRVRQKFQDILAGK